MTTSGQSSPKLKRRQYYVKKSFQANLIGKFILIVLASSIISSVLLYYLVHSEIEANYYAAHTKIRNTGELLLPSILITNFLVILVSSAVTVAVVVMISHKIAGPLFKFEMVAREIAKGNLSVSANLRKLDQLKDLSAAFNDMIGGLKDTIGRISAQIEQMQRSLDGAKEKVSDQAALAELEQQLKQLQESVKQFEV